MAATTLLGGRYELHARIGVGGYGEVWRAMDTVLARPVAVKLLQAEHAREPETMQRFRAEARSAGALSHPCIAHVYDYFEPAPPDPPFLVMELVDGPSLAEMISRAPLGAAQTMDILAQAAEGLHAAHQAGLVHRDIKPGNLLVSRDGPVKITDFGIAHAAVGTRPPVSGPVTMVGMVLGTAGYMAPERVAGAPATVASDLYALGVVAHECLAGPAWAAGPGASPTAGDATPGAPQSPAPWSDGRRAARTPAAPPPAALPPGVLAPLPPSVPPDVAAFVARLTAPDPAARPATAGEVARQAAALRDRYRDYDDIAAPTRPGRGTGRPGRRTPATDPDPWSGAHRAAGRRPSRAVLALAGAAVLGVGLLIFGILAALHQHGSAPPAAGNLRPGPTPGPMVTLSDTSLVGQQYRPVRRQLTQMGLVVHLVWRPTSADPAGEVLAVRPDGPVRVGSTVIVTVAESAGPTLGPAPSLGVSPSVNPSHPAKSASAGPSGHPSSSGSGSASASSSASSSPSVSPSGSGGSPTSTASPSTTP